jgi:hypothetical protein
MTLKVLDSQHFLIIQMTIKEHNMPFLTKLNIPFKAKLSVSKQNSPKLSKLLSAHLASSVAGSPFSLLIGSQPTGEGTSAILNFKK